MSVAPLGILPWGHPRVSFPGPPWVSVGQLGECLLSLLSSVLESDPEFGFEEAKQQLEGKPAQVFPWQHGGTPLTWFGVSVAAAAS